MKRLAVLLALLSADALAQTVEVPCPSPDRPIADLADVLGAPAAERIAQVCRNLQEQKQIPLVVVTIPSLQQQGGEGLGIERFAMHVLAQRQFDVVEGDGRNWEKAILVLVSLKDRKCRVELSTSACTTPPGAAGSCSSSRSTSGWRACSATTRSSSASGSRSSTRCAAFS